MEPTEDRVRQAQQGDDVAFRRLVRDVHPQILRWALIQTASRDDAEDVAQAALVSMHRHLGAFRHGSRFTTWLYAIVRRAAADWRRAQRRRTEREQRHVRNAVMTYTQDPPPEDDVMAKVRVLMGDLPARQREIFDLADLQGIPQGEVAQVLELNPNTVRVHLLRARRAIRSRLLAQSPELLEDHVELS